MKKLVFLSFFVILLLISSCAKESTPIIEDDAIERSASRRGGSEIKLVVDFNPNDDLDENFIVVADDCYGESGSRTYYTKGKDCISIETDDYGTLNGGCSFTVVKNKQKKIEYLRFWIKNKGKNEPLFTTPDMKVSHVQEQSNGSFVVVFQDTEVWLRKHKGKNAGPIVDHEVVQLTFTEFHYTAVEQ